MGDDDQKGYGNDRRESVGYDTLVLSGGGKRGIAHLGALNVLSHYRRCNFTTYIGCSIGAMIASFLACGISIHDITMSLFSNEISMIGDTFKSIKFEDISISNIDISGLLDNSILSGYVERFLTRYNIDKNISFGDIKKKYGNTLIMNTTNVSSGRAEYFSPDTHSNFRISNAAKMSCCIPGIFRPVVYNDRLYYDGAIMDNLPICKAPPCSRVLAISLEDMVEMNQDEYMTTIVNIPKLSILRIQTMTIEMYKKEDKFNVFDVVRIIFTRAIPFTLIVTDMDKTLYEDGCREAFRFLEENKTWPDPGDGNDDAWF